MDDLEKRIDALEARVRELEAIHEIRNVAAAYALAADAGDEETWVGQFSEDGVLDVSTFGGADTVFAGRKALTRFFRRALASDSIIQQQATNVHITVCSDTAKGTVFWTARTRLPDGTLRRGAGRYTDEYVKTDKGWKISKRVLTKSS